MTYAPIAIFVYKRPDHTRRLLNSLRKNPEVKHSEIYIFADGVKKPNDQAEVLASEEVRKVCSSIDFAKKVHLNYSPVNKGLASSIIDGVTGVLSEYDRIIVLEDDLELSPKFLSFMNVALETYESLPQVFHISGYWFPVRNCGSLPPTFFYNTASCWGWATWARAWKHFEADPAALKEKVKRKDPKFKKFNFNGYADFLRQLDLNIEGKLRTWAVKWYASMFIHDGFALHPRISYVNNIGHDASGENCGTNTMYNWGQLAKDVNLQKIPLSENMAARKLMTNFYKAKKGSPFSLIEALKKAVPLPVKCFIKEKILQL